MDKEGNQKHSSEHERGSMAYIRMADRPKELPKRLQRIKENLNNPEYMDTAIFNMADRLSRIITGRDKYGKKPIMKKPHLQNPMFSDTLN